MDYKEEQEQIAKLKAERAKLEAENAKLKAKIEKQIQKQRAIDGTHLDSEWNKRLGENKDK